jgi:hypothetical protein
LLEESELEEVVEPVTSVDPVSLDDPLLVLDVDVEPEPLDE